jgi:hypothetical protein
MGKPQPPWAAGIKREAHLEVSEVLESENGSCLLDDELVKVLNKGLNVLGWNGTKEVAALLGNARPK